MITLKKYLTQNPTGSFLYCSCPTLWNNKEIQKITIFQSKYVGAGGADLESQEQQQGIRFFRAVMGVVGADAVLGLGGFEVPDFFGSLPGRENQLLRHRAGV